MNDKKQIVYILSALEMTTKNIKKACLCKFQRITPEYILVYDENIPTDAVEITALDLKELTEQDMDWLQKCNMTLINEFIETHKDSQRKSFQEFLTELDANIKIELEKVKTNSNEGA